MPERIHPNSPEFADIDAWMYLLKMLTDPACYFDMAKQLEGMPGLEKDVAIQDLLNNIQAVIDAQSE